MAALFAMSAAVNLNDPDPIRWVAIYGAAGILSIVVVLTGTVPLLVSAVVGAIALAWSLMWARRVPGHAYRHMFDEWEMKSTTVEEARETCGLAIVALWMLASIVWSLFRTS